MRIAWLLWSLLWAGVRLVVMLFWFAAADAANVQWQPGGSIAWTSDYVFRGVSQSDQLPALQGELHLRPTEQWTLGVWASSVRLVPAHRFTELDFYVDRHWAIDQDLAVSVTAVHYSYLNDPRPVSHHYDELSLSMNWLDAYFLSASWSPDTALSAYLDGVQTQQQTLTVEGGYHQALPLRMELLLAAGYFDPLEQHEGGYTYGSAGLSRKFGSLRAELSWFWTQNEIHRRYTPGRAGGPWAATVMWQF